MNVEEADNAPSTSRDPSSTDVDIIDSPTSNGTRYFVHTSQYTLHNIHLQLHISLLSDNTRVTVMLGYRNINSILIGLYSRASIIRGL